MHTERVQTLADCTGYFFFTFIFIDASMPYGRSYKKEQFCFLGKIEVPSCTLKCCVQVN